MARLIPSVYRHTQSTPSATWVIEHNLYGNGSDGTPLVDVLIDVNGTMTKMIPLSVTKTNAGVLTLTFSTARSGLAVVTM